MSFNENSRVNSQRQKQIGRNNIVFNKVRPTYKLNVNPFLDGE